MIPALAEAGHRDVLVAPIGFIADHVEVLYDLDIGLQQIAAAHGVHMERPAMLNDSPCDGRCAGGSRSRSLAMSLSRMKA